MFQWEGGWRSMAEKGCPWVPRKGRKGGDLEHGWKAEQWAGQRDATPSKVSRWEQKDGQALCLSKCGDTTYKTAFDNRRSTANPVFNCSHSPSALRRVNSVSSKQFLFWALLLSPSWMSSDPTGIFFSVFLAGPFLLTGTLNAEGLQPLVLGSILFPIYMSPLGNLM